MASGRRATDGALEAAEPPLTRGLGLWGATLSGVGIILGAGIYVIIGAAAEDAGSAVWLSFLIAALLAGATGLSYAELAGMFPEAGASPVYVREAFGPRAGFVLGWLRLAISVISGAAVAIGFASYFDDLAGLPSAPTALGVLLLSGVIVVLGVRETIVVAVVMTLIEAAGLVFVILVGLPDLGSRDLLDAPNGALGVMACAALVFFAFEGFEQIATLSEETRDPTRTIPRAILIAIVTSAVLYALVAVTAVSVVDGRALAASDAPLADVAGVAVSGRAADVLSTVALFATFNTVLLMLATASRRAYGMAGRGMLPAIFRTVGQRRRTPWVAALVVTSLAGLLTFGGDIRFVAQASNFAVFVAFVLVNATLIWLRHRRPEAPRPFRVPLAIGAVPISALLGGLGAIVFAAVSDVEAALVVVAVLAVGVALSPFAVRGAEAADAAR